MATNVDITCPVCKDPLKDPRSLECRHTFCSKCLIGHFQTQDGQCPLTCPVCRGRCHDVSGGDDLSTSISNLSIEEAVCAAIHQHEKTVLEDKCRYFKMLDTRIQSDHVTVASMKDPIQQQSIETIPLPSSDVFLPVLKQVACSFANIWEHVTMKGKFAVYPKDRTNIAPEVNAHLQTRLHDIAGDSFGLCYVSRCMATAINSPRCLDPPEDVLCDVFIVTSVQAPLLLTIVQDSVSKSEKGLVKYSSMLTRAVLSSLLDFTDASVTILSGIVNVSKLKDQSSFAAALKEIQTRSSSYCIPDALKMDPAKCRDVVTAFLRAVAVIRSTGIHTDDASEEELWFLTSEQFIVLTENIDKCAVFVNAVLASGSTVLMVEVANRLEKSGRTLLICESKDLAEKAKEVCSNVLTSGDANAVVQEGTYRNIVAEADALKKLELPTGSFRHIWVFHSKECSQCHNEGNEEIAVMWCEECQEALCSTHAHNHSLLSGARTGETLYCKVHVKKEIELYCKDHRTEICMICSQTKHKMCRNISCISDD